MKSSLLMLSMMVVYALSQNPTTCQISSYYDQLVQCPQLKNSQYYYTSAEISTVCSMCGATSTPPILATNTRCCPQNYAPIVNGSMCTCSSPGQPDLFCVGCGYSLLQKYVYCDASRNISRFASFSSGIWACPNYWADPTSGVLGWTCSCGTNGTPCLYCSPILYTTNEAYHAAQPLIALSFFNLF